jgi:hypothetical protein
MDSALIKLRKWESEIQFVNMVRQIHEHGNTYRKLHGEEAFQELLEKIPTEHVNDTLILMLTLMAVSVMFGVIATVAYLVA